ncbi:MAG: L-rhamnose mutarotase [Geminicoccaceae bacterium]
MQKIAFTMKLHPGQRAEYERRHNEIWPELLSALRDAGISDYSIFLDEETNTLFAVLKRTDDHRMDALPEQEVMKRWWAHMSDIMETHPDNAPLVTPLVQVFRMN